MVTQDVQLFQATVRDNLTFFNSDIPDERILEVIEELELGDWYATLPNGLDTRLETGGRSLSAGEAQLLAFARVFLRDPGLVILDEASSRLDPATEMLIERAIDRLLRDRTGIVIAHRLGTVQRADEIMILEGGEIVELGHAPGWPPTRTRASTACCRPAWRRCWHDHGAISPNASPATATKNAGPRSRPGTSSGA